MKKHLKNPNFYILLFFLINLLQSVFTPIGKDEAYYWMYAQHPDWGYFDHPPFVGWMIWFSDLFLDGVAGVRLMTAVFSGATLWILWLLVDPQDKKVDGSVPAFFLLALSFPILNIYGFITTPDVPLLFFSALYLLMYKRFVGNSTLVNALLLGLVAALLMYSKYHGAFVILFSILASIRLLWNRFFYLAGIFALLLYMPHILWQIEYDFISFRYHLYQRTEQAMDLKHVVDYGMNAFIILNPFLFGLFLYLLARKRLPKDIPLVYPVIFWGFVGFFGFNSFRDHIEPQWIGVATIPLLITLHKGWISEHSNKKYLLRASVLSLGLFFCARLALVLPLPLDTEFHKQGETYYQTIRDRAGGEKMVFVNTYYDAAKFTFYTGDPAFSYNCYDYRKNQYDLWNYEDMYHLRPVFLVSGYVYPWADSTFTAEGRDWCSHRIHAFPMINKVQAFFNSIETQVDSKSNQRVEFVLHNPYSYPIDFNTPEHPLSFFVVYQEGLDRTLFPLYTDGPERLEPGQEMIVSGTYEPDMPAGTYLVALGLQPLKISPVLITDKIKVTVAPQQ